MFEESHTKPPISQSIDQSNSFIDSESENKLDLSLSEKAKEVTKSIKSVSIMVSELIDENKTLKAQLENCRSSKSVFFNLYLRRN